MDLQKLLQSASAKVNGLVQQFIQPAVQHNPIVNYFNPNATENINHQTGQNNGFWSPDNPVASIISGQKQISQINLDAAMGHMTQKIQNPLLRFGAQAGLGVADSLLNTPANLVQAPINVARDVNAGDTNVRHYAADIAPFAEGMLNVATLGGGTLVKGVAEQGLKQGIKSGLLQGVKTGGKYGAAYGAINGLETGRDLQQPDYLGNLALNTGAGALGGAALGGAFGGITGIPRSTVTSVLKKLFPKDSTPQLAQKADQYIESRLRLPSGSPKGGQFTGKDSAGFSKNKPVKVTRIGETVGWMNRVDGEIKDMIPQPGLSIKTVNSKKGMPLGNYSLKRFPSYDPDAYKGIHPDNIVHFNQGANARVTLVVSSLDKEMIQAAKAIRSGKSKSASYMISQLKNKGLSHSDAVQKILDTADNYKQLARENAHPTEDTLLNTMVNSRLGNQSGRMSKTDPQLLKTSASQARGIPGQPPTLQNTQQAQLPLRVKGQKGNQISSLPLSSQEQSISQDARKIMLAGELKDKSLPLRMQGSERYAPNARKMLEGKYVGLSNKETIATAKHAVRLDPEAAELRAMNPQNATDQAIGIELFNHYMDSGKVARANAIMNATSGTNEGQMIQILSQYDKSTPGGAVKFATNLVKNYNRTNPHQPLKLTDEMVQGFYKQAQKVQSMPEGKARNIAANKLINDINQLIPSTFADKAIAVWKAGLLTSLRTHERNIFGNTVHGIAEIIKDIPASLADQAMALSTGKRSITLTTQGIGSGAQKGYQAAKDIIKTGYDPEQSISKYDVKQINWGNNPVEQSLKIYTNAVFRTLGAADKPFYNSAYARSLYDQAGAAAINAGKQGNGKFIKSLVKNPTTEMLKQATIDANKATFKNTNMLSKVAGEFKRVASQNELTKVGSEVLAPFTGVPSAVAGQIFEYSPAGLIRGAINMGRVMAGSVPELQRQAAQEVGRGVVGTGLAGLGAFLMSKGLMTGQPKDQAEARQWELENKPRNSIMIGGQWRSINSIGPEALVVLAGAKAAEEYSKGEDASMGTFGASVGQDFMSQTFLQGVMGPVQAVNDPQRYAKEYLGNLSASPIPNIVKDAAKSLDPYQRENNQASLNPLENVFVKNSLPLIRNQSIVKRDALGSPMPQEPSGPAAFVDLLNSKTPQSSSVIDELSRLNKEGYNATPGKLQKTQTIQGEKMKLTPQQLDVLESTVGPQARSTLQELFQTPDYQSLSDEDKSKAVDSVLSSVRKQVRGNIDVNQKSDNIGQIANQASADTSPSGKTYTIVNPDSGAVKRIDLSKAIDAPKLTGYADLDKKLVSKYKGEITARQNDIIALYQTGKIDAATAHSEISKLIAQSDHVTNKKGAKGKKIKVPTLKAPQLSKKKGNFKKYKVGTLPKRPIQNVNFTNPFTNNATNVSVPNFKAKIKFNV